MEVTGYLGKKLAYCSKSVVDQREGREKVKGIWWIKRDFRISDNQCLVTGLDECEELLPFFVGKTVSCLITIIPPFTCKLSGRL